MGTTDYSQQIPSSLVYLAGPIDFVDKNVAKNWREQAGAILREKNIGTFNPATAFGGHISHSTLAVAEINLEAMRVCDGIIFYVNSKVPQFGTPYEWAYNVLTLGKPFSIFCPDGVVPMYVKMNSKRSHDTIDNAVEDLVNQFVSIFYQNRGE